MDSKKVQIKLQSKPYSYEVKIGNNLLTNAGVWANSCLSENTKKIAIISNEKVFGLYGKSVVKSIENEGFDICTWLMQDGEEYKNLESLKEALNFFSEHKLKRTNAVIALGGGVVGDLSGFASSIYLRGIPFLQIPTTLLAMIDSSVGGKTAVNTEFGKNLVGTFYQPKGVLVDVDTLKTLEHREIVAGFCEAIKQGAIGNKKLFDETADFLRTNKLNEFVKNLENKEIKSQLEYLLSSQIAFKAEIVIQDEQESANRVDSKSRKILNFGHTTAHALEKITDYKYFKHGEAVGIGILVAAEIAKRLEILKQDSINLLNNVVSLVGELPKTNNINIDDLLELFVFDKKTIGESLQWVLLEDIGKPKIVPNRSIPKSIIKKSLKTILEK